jgi:hypothetical protein
VHNNKLEQNDPQSQNIIPTGMNSSSSPGVSSMSPPAASTASSIMSSIGSGSSAAPPTVPPAPGSDGVYKNLALAQHGAC